MRPKNAENFALHNLLLSLTARQQPATFLDRLLYREKARCWKLTVNSQCTRPSYRPKHPFAADWTGRWSWLSPWSTSTEVRELAP